MSSRPSIPQRTDVRTAAAERQEAERRDEAQRRQIATLEAVRDRQQEMTGYQIKQIADGRAIATAQGTVIDN